MIVGMSSRLRHEAAGHPAQGTTWLDGWRVFFGPLRVIKRGRNKGKTEGWEYTPGRKGGDYKKVMVNSWTDFEKVDHGRVKSGTEFKSIDE